MKLKDFLTQYQANRGIQEVTGFHISFKNGEILNILNDNHPALERDVGDGSEMTVRLIQSATAGLRGNFVDQRFPLSDQVFPQTQLTRITFDPQVMGGKPCIRNLRITVGTIVGLVASEYSTTAILQAYPYLEEQDIRQALAYAAWRAEELEVPLTLVA